ncbi:MAG: cytochrome c [Gemmatimonadota bacterium]|nr:cytochrome c [Gemmatimonadota bacterium]
MRVTWIVLAVAGTAACSGGAAAPGRAAPTPGTYGLGRAPTAAELAAEDIDAAPNGHGLPAGRGTAAEGAALFRVQCAGCHGDKGQGMAPAFPALIGRDPGAEGFRFAGDPRLVKTIGNYWPYATTVFDYVRRAMPHTAPGSLTNDQVYALTAYLLAANQVIPEGGALDSASLVGVKMPYHDRFVPDDRRGGSTLR